MVFSSIYTLVLTLTCSPPSLFCSTHCRCGSFTSMPRLASAYHNHALPLHCVTKPCLASATLCCSMLCRCNSTPFYADAILFYAKLCRCVPLQISAIPRHSTPSPIIATPCHRNSTLFYADAIPFVAVAKPLGAMPCLSNSYYAYPLRLFCVSVQLALCSAAASLAVLLLHYAYASLNVTNHRHAYAFQRLTKP